MAIYSLNHKAIGKATQDRPFTAAAHVRYITRNDACRAVLGERMPIDAKKAQTWFRSEEKADRKNARVCDKIMVALPRELNQEQREALVSDFASRVTKGQAPWMAAIHDKGKDRRNPHCHLVMRDRDTHGKRCLHMSAGKAERALLKERGIDAMTTDRMREIWERTANDHLERAGHRERIDRRTLEAQGIDRLPTVHEGVQARQMVARGVRPTSKMLNVPNAPTARSDRRPVDYLMIDRGKTREEYNQTVKQRSGGRLKITQNLLAEKVNLADNFQHERTGKTTLSEALRRYGGGSTGQPRIHRKNDRSQSPDVGDRDTRPREGWLGSTPVGDTSSSSSGGDAETTRAGHEATSGYSRVAPRYSRRRGIDFSFWESENMSVKDRFDAMEKHADSPEELLSLLKWRHREAQREQLKNARDFEAGRKAEKDAQELAAACVEEKNEAEKRLVKSELGRDYLHGKKAQQVREELHREDSEQRQKDRDAARLAEIEKKVDKTPRAAEVSKEAVEPEEGKRKARDAMSFLLKPSKSKDLRPKERDKDKDKDRGWEPE